MKKKKKPSKRNIFRIRFPEDEGKHPWLPMLLDAFAVINEGVAVGIEKEMREKGRALACRAGCGLCCSLHTDIAVYPVELAGISWYVVEKVEGEVREALKRQLSLHDRKPPCPFLVRDQCSIYPVRPMTCRQFNVFTKPCEMGEDPYFTRRQDVLAPIQEYVDRAVYMILPFFGVEDSEERHKAIKTGALQPLLQNLHECNWKSLVRKMEDFGASRSRA